MLGTELYEVIYALQVDQWGKGLASEASIALLSQAFELKDPDIEEIFALVYPQNVKSILVLERLGMTFMENRLDSVSQRNASLFRISKSTFHKRHHTLGTPID